jgi:hypothetical protein
MRRVLVALIAAVAFLALDRPARGEADPWFSKFSIIAFDPATNELGGTRPGAISRCRATRSPARRS